jgi:hypothetical protein
LAEVLLKIDPTGRNIIYIDWFLQKLSELTSLNEDEKYALVFSVVDPKKVNLAEVEINKQANMLYNGNTVTKPALNGQRANLAAVYQVISSNLGEESLEPETFSPNNKSKATPPA